MDKNKTADLAGRRPELRTKLVPLLKKAAKAGSLAANGDWLRTQDKRLAKKFHADVVKELDVRLAALVPDLGPIRTTWDSTKEVLRGDASGIAFSVYVPWSAFLQLETLNLQLMISVERAHLTWNQKNVDFFDPDGLADFLASKVATMIGEASK